MRLVLASGNQGKVKEIMAYLQPWEVVPYTDVISKMEIEEHGDTFQANAIIKAQAVFEALGDPHAFVIADDSGISVPALGGEPGIYSARYAGEGASDKENLHKLVAALKRAGLSRTPAFYTCAIAVVAGNGTWTTHGWMHGEAITEPEGDGGFGYDPMFVPQGYRETIAQLDPAVKERLSHRTKALALARPLLKVLSL